MLKSINAYLICRYPGREFIESRIGHAMVSFSIKSMMAIVSSRDGTLKNIKRVVVGIVGDKDVTDSLKYYAPTTRDSRIVPLLMRFKLVNLIALILMLKR